MPIFIIVNLKKLVKEILFGGFFCIWYNGIGDNMKVLCYGSYKGSRIYNGDVLGIKDDMYFVLDGSTALFDDYKFGDAGDLYCYMQKLRDNFNNNEKDISHNLQRAIKLSNEDFVGIEKYKEYELPTYTIAVVRELDKELEYYILCDTLISILYKDGHIENILDKRIDPVKEVCRSRNREIKNLDISDTEKKKLVLENERETRIKVNIDGGFPVGSTKVDSVLEGYNGKIDKELIDRILICSDGYYDSDEVYPSSKEEFNIDYVRERVNNKLLEDVRDDLSYILIEM